MMSRRSVYRREGGWPQSDEGSVNKGVDADTLEFIQKYLTSYTKWEVLKFFGENPTSTETARGFARRLGKDARQINEALKSLVRAGILAGNGRDSDTGSYSLAADEAARAILRRIAETARANNRFRLLLNYHITKASLAKYKSERP